jgi:DNA-binding transcriptional MerR regulator
MEEKIYTISDLEREGGISRRNIHFYIKEGLLPRPEGAGVGSRYGEEHLLRLMMIKELQKIHLKLSGIKEELKNYTCEQMRDLLRQEGRKSTPPRDIGELGNFALVQASKMVDSCLDERASVSPGSFSFLNIGKSLQRQAEHEKERVRPASAPKVASVKEASWQRFEVMDGVEISIRSDMLKSCRHQVKAIAELLNKNVKEAP